MSRIVVAAVAAFVLAASAPSLAAEVHSHDAAQAPHAIALDNGRKWATDAPLREGMGQIRDALARKQAAMKEGTLGDAGYAELGAAIETSVASIVANCKLPPEADANLHIVVAELVGAADTLQGKSEGQRVEGARKAIDAVNLYRRYFDHPGLKPLA